MNKWRCPSCAAMAWLVATAILCSPRCKMVQAFSTAGHHYGVQSLRTIHAARGPFKSNPSTMRVSVVSMLGPETGRLATTLIGSSWIGQWVDRASGASGTGILGALLSGALLGRLMRVPKEHLLLDWAWTYCLPASLAFLLLAFQSPRAAEANGSPSEDARSYGEDISIAKSIQVVGLPFLIASISSCVACLIAFRFMVPLSHWWSPMQARVMTACLSASLVGGSVNCFAVAQQVGATPSFLSALATSDLIVLAVYLVGITAGLQSKRMQKWYQPNAATDKPLLESPLPTIDTSDFEAKRGPIVLKTTFFESILALGVVSSLTLGIVLVANAVQERLNPWIPGMACAFIAIVAPWINLRMEKTQTKDYLVLGKFWKRMQSWAAMLSEFSFLYVFASIGMQANLQQALASGPACLVFAAMSYSLHVVGTLGACRLLRLLPFYHRHMHLADVLIASNAAIGGPATAAAFCQGMTVRKRGRTLAATVWGVVGYAVGTLVGMEMYRLTGWLCVKRS